MYWRLRLHDRGAAIDGIDNSKLSFETGRSNLRQKILNSKQTNSLKFGQFDSKQID